MIKDFSSATQNRLLSQIESIKKKQLCSFTDFFGDLWTRGGKWIGHLHLNEDMSNVESYQRKVLDMTNMTKNQLNKLFQNVYKIDSDYQSKFSELNLRESEYNNKIRSLIDQIHPNFSISDASTIRSVCAAHNTRLKSIEKSINKSFDKELDWAAKQAAMKSTKGVFESIFYTAVDLVCLPVSTVKNVVTGNWAGVASDTQGLINDVFSVGGNLVGLTVLVFIPLSGKNKKKKNLAITYSETYSGVKGLSDVMEAEEKINGKSAVTTFTKKAAQGIDTFKAGYDLVDGAKSFIKEPTKLSSNIDYKFGFKGKYEVVKKKDMIEKYQTNYRSWQGLERHLGNHYHVNTIKNLKNGYSFLEPAWDTITDGTDVAIDNEAKTITSKFSKVYHQFSDASSLGEDVNSLIFEW